MGATPEPPIGFEEERSEQESRISTCSFCGPCKVHLFFVLATLYSGEYKLFCRV
jgi:hypothetical protein